MHGHELNAALAKQRLEELLSGAEKRRIAKLAKKAKREKRKQERMRHARDKEAERRQP